ncbi:MAG: DUF364 domain-containing protein [Anaerolineaceae bacterium]|nr:DUF364 domain-containing protein [Anaerolineaceae bacterium]
MKIIEDVLSTLTDAKVNDVRIGLHWTAVVVEKHGKHACGLASTVNNTHHREGIPDVESAGDLCSLSALQLADFALSSSNIKSSIGIAAMNALIEPKPTQWQEINAEQVLAKEGNGKNIAVIGSFPFVNRLKDKVNKIYVFDLNPAEGEFGPEAAAKILPDMDVIAITGMTLVNKTLDDLLPYCNPGAVKMMLGPSTFLSDMMFDYGFDLVSGAYVDKIVPVIQTMCEGGTFKQVHRAGVRLVTMAKATLINPG